MCKIRPGYATADKTEFAPSLAGPMWRAAPVAPRVTSQVAPKATSRYAHRMLAAFVVSLCRRRSETIDISPVSAAHQR